MRFARFAMAAFLSGGLVGYATGAAAGGGNPRLQGEFYVDDTHDPIDHNEAFVLLIGSDFAVNGEVESHDGTQTAGVPDTVIIQYRADLPNHAKAGDDTIEIKQHEYSELRLIINSDTPARNLDLTVYPQKCSVNAKVNAAKAHGRVTAKCSGNDIFAEVSADQVASMIAAFANAPDIKIKVNSNGKGSLEIIDHGTVVTPVEN